MTFTIEAVSLIAVISAAFGFFLGSLFWPAKRANDVEPLPRDAEPFLTPGRTVTPAQLIAETEVSMEEMAARRAHGGEPALQARLCKELMMNLYRQHLIAFSCQEDKIFRVWRYRAQLQVLPPKEAPHDL
jgi:hypothetical protein